MLTAEQALKIAKPNLEAEKLADLERLKVQSENQLNDILELIRGQSERNKTALALDWMPLPTVEGQLLGLGYRTSYFDVDYQNSAIVIKWNSPNPVKSQGLGFNSWIRKYITG